MNKLEKAKAAVKFELTLAELYFECGAEADLRKALGRAAKAAKKLGALHPEPVPRTHKHAFK